MDMDERQHFNNENIQISNAYMEKNMKRKQKTESKTKQKDTQ